MKLVMFDMDGTIVDTQAFILNTMREAFTAEDLPPPEADEARRLIGLSLPVLISHLSGLDGEDVTRLEARYRAVYREKLAKEGSDEQLYPGAHDVISALSEDDDALLGIATGKGLQGVNRVLGVHGLNGYFDTRQTPDHNPSKPHPAMLYRAMDETGTDPDRTVMIGDTTFDMEMAVAASTRAIGVSWGYHETRDLIEAGAEIIVDRYVDLISAIDELTDE